MSQKWEYKVLLGHYANGPLLLSALTELGADGWEAFAADGYHGWVYLKRLAGLE